jgi:hypothetical protein
VNRKHAATPIEVVERERTDLALAQTEACEEKKDRVVTLADQRPSIAARKQPTNFPRGDPSREAAGAPGDCRWNRRRQIARQPAADEKKTEEAAKVASDAGE